MTTVPALLVPSPESIDPKSLTNSSGLLAWEDETVLHDGDGPSVANDDRLIELITYLVCVIPRNTSRGGILLLLTVNWD
jgi:hypothetical protein